MDYVPADGIEPLETEAVGYEPVEDNDVESVSYMPADDVHTRSVSYVDADDVDSGLVLEKLGGDVRRGAARSGAVVELPWPRLGERDQLLDRAHRKGGVDDEHVRLASDQRHR